MRGEANTENYTALGKVLLELRQKEGINIQEQCLKFGYKYSIINKVNIGERSFSRFAFRHILEIYRDDPETQKKLILAWVPDQKKEELKHMGFSDEQSIVLYAKTNLGMFYGER